MARRSFGHVRQLPSGKWNVRYHRNGRLVGGGTFQTKADASRALARIQVAMDKGELLDPKAGRIRFEAYAQTWVETRRVKGAPLAPRTAQEYRWQLKKHILPTFGKLELGKIDPASVRIWFARMQGPEGPGQSTAAKCYRLLRAILNTAVEDELIPKNPCAIKGAGQEASSERPMLTRLEVESIAAAVAQRWRALILMAAWCGLRFGELAALRTVNVDPGSGTVTVTEAMSLLQGGKRHIGKPKSEAGRRVVNVPPHILPALREHRANFAEPDGLFFVGPLGGRLSSANFGADVWRPALKQLGIEGVHFHDLRGVSATLAARHGATTKELMRRLGHSTPDMAMRYQRAEAERDRALAEAMSEGLTH
jgi:integrase